MKEIGIKEGVSVADLTKLSSPMYIAIGIARSVLEARGKDFIVTSLISDREDLKGVSEVHGEGCGVDIRTWGWSESEKQEFKLEVDSLCEGLAPEGRDVVVIEPDHIHLQTRKNIILVT